MQTSPISARASANLDMIRGLAALAVMIGHVRALFYVDYSHILKGNALVSAAYCLTGVGCLSRLTEVRTDSVRHALLFARQYGVRSVVAKHLSALVGINSR